MDYLRNLGSAAVSTLVQKSGLNLPFSIGVKVKTFEGTCNLYDGTRRDDSSPVSIFEYDLSDSTKRNLKSFATNAFRKLRTTRHPDVLKFMDVVETDSTIYVMTESVQPLQNVLQSWSSRESQQREDWLLWGLHRISVALAFVNDSCSSTHGKICVDAIFISPSGEWKLGGFELLSSTKEDPSTLYSMGGLFPGSSMWASPEIKKEGWSVLKEYEPSVADAYALGLLLHAIFNPSHPPPLTAQPPHSPPSPSSRGSIPSSVFPFFKKLLNPSPKARLTAKDFLENGMADTGFFATNRLIQVCLGLDNFELGTEADKNTLLRKLKESAPAFPPEFASNRVLPSLVTALEFGGASAAVILPLVLQLGANVPPEDYPNVVLTPLVKLFASPDRGTRMALLEHLGEYADRLDKKTVSEKIFPHLQTGFSDTVAIIREATTKSIILLAPKLNDRILNNDLLRYLAKMQTDTEASIRTNTCILIGRLGPMLGYHTKRKVLVPAFSRALKDSFTHTRVAGLMAFMATIDCFEIEEIANKVIPNIAFAMIDKEKLVRDQGFKAVELFVKKLENHASTMPHTALPESNNPVGVSLPQQATLVYSATGAAGALAGWAITSLGKKLLPGDLQSTIDGNPTAATDEHFHSPPQAGILAVNSPISNHGQKSALPVHAVISATPSLPFSPTLQPTSRTKGLDLGSRKVSSNRSTAVLADRLAEEAAMDVTNNPWGNDDLIDINADQDDWSAFESSPPVILEPKPLPAVASTIGRVASPSYCSVAAQPTAHHTPPKRGSTPLSLSPPPSEDGRDEAGMKPFPTMSGLSSLSKEEKAAEMARKKDERKQRIALLKEQKKNTTRV